MSVHRLQHNRFELKYIIPEHVARQLRDFIRSYLVPDEFARPELEGAYPIHSVYIDGPGFPLANGTIDGLKNRFKLRIRYYDENSETPVFFEIKRRVNDAILKERAAVRRESVPRLLEGHWPDTRDLLNPGKPRQYEALRHFMELRDRIQGQGRCIVSYLREAWVPADDNSVRVTFDRKLVATPFDGRLLVADFEHGLQPSIHGTILELKFTDRFPGWMRNMVHIFNLQRCSMPKYVECLSSLQPRMLNWTSQGSEPELGLTP